MSSPLDNLFRCQVAIEHFKSVFEDEDIILPVLRSLRNWFSESDGTPISQEECSTALSILTDLVTDLVSPIHRAHLDKLDGKHHLVLSVSLQCLTNCLSYMSPRAMHIAGEVAASLLTLFIYDLRIQCWLFSLDTFNSLSLWRLRLASYSFILTTNLVSSVQRSGISADFARVVLIAVRCAQRVVSAAANEKANETEDEQNGKLLQEWFDHCLSLIATLCGQPQSTGSRKSAMYVLQISQAVGYLLLMASFEDSLERLGAPDMMRKLAYSCLLACLPSSADVAKNSTLLIGWVKECRSVLSRCVRDSSPFTLSNSEDDSIEVQVPC